MYKGKEDDILRDYEEGKLGTIEIARKYRISTETLNELVDLAGVEKRGRGAQLKYKVVYPAMVEILREKKLNYQTLAMMVNSTPEYLSKVLSGRTPLTRRMAARIAKAVEMDTSALFGDVPDPRDTEQRGKRKEAE